MRRLNRSRSQGGFTLIELMIVVAIIGILAAVAVPNFIRYQARSRRSEAYANLASAVRAYTTYDAEKGSYPDMLTTSGEVSLPDPGLYGGLGTQKMPWDAQTKGFFDIFGFATEGTVFYSYDFNSAANCTCTKCFTATAHGDVDGDGGWGMVMYVHPQRDAAGAVVGECQSGVGPWPGPGAYDEVAIKVGFDDF
jgi:type IV pilus assembly protein PilA